MGNSTAVQEGGCHFESPGWYVAHSCGVAHEGGCHFESPGWYVAHSSLHVVWDPLHEIGRVLVLDVQHLFVDFLHGHSSPEHGSHGEVPSVSGVTGSHHVLCIEHLLGEFRY